MKPNNSTVFNKGYVAGYNQCKVDKKEMTQEEADEILKNWKDEAEEEIE